MLDINKHRIVWWPVTIRAPKPDGSGGVEEYQAEFKFKLPTIPEIREAAGRTLEENLEWYDRHVLDWKPFAQDGDKAIEFSRENLRALLYLSYVENAVSLAILQAASGRAAVKN